MKTDLFLNIQEAIVELNKSKIEKFTNQIIQEGIDPIEAIEMAYTKGIQKVGDLFGEGVLFLPELVAAGDIVTKAVTKLEKLISQGTRIQKGKMVLGTVKGDIHDIGKNLVGTMLSANSIEVIDIGIDCSVDKFIDRALEENADIIGASCLLTTTSPELEKLIMRLEERNLRDRFKVIVGGAAINKEWAESIGADGYGKDLKEAPEIVFSILETTKTELH